jgi:hypothetical protein
MILKLNWQDRWKAAGDGLEAGGNQKRRNLRSNRNNTATAGKLDEWYLGHIDRDLSQKIINGSEIKILAPCAAKQERYGCKMYNYHSLISCNTRWFRSSPQKTRRKARKSNLTKNCCSRKQTKPQKKKNKKKKKIKKKICSKLHALRVELTNGRHTDRRQTSLSFITMMVMYLGHKCIPSHIVLRQLLSEQCGNAMARAEGTSRRGALHHAFTCI